MDLLCPLISARCNGRVDDGYSTKSDGIFDEIFPIVHRTNLSTELLYRLLALGFFLCSKYVDI